MSWLCACATAVSVAFTESAPQPALARSALVSVTTWVVTPPLGAGAAVLGAGAGGFGRGAVRVCAGADIVGRGAGCLLRNGDAVGCSRPAGGMITTRLARSAGSAAARSAAARSAADRSPVVRPPSKDAGAAALDGPDPFDALARATAVPTAAVARAVGRTTQRLRGEKRAIGVLPAGGVGRRAQYGRSGKDQDPRTRYRRWRTVRTTPDQVRCAPDQVVLHAYRTRQFNRTGDGFPPSAKPRGRPDPG